MIVETELASQYLEKETASSCESYTHTTRIIVQYIEHAGSAVQKHQYEYESGTVGKISKDPVAVDWVVGEIWHAIRFLTAFDRRTQTSGKRSRKNIENRFYSE
jgi:hypothetical protein